MTFDYLQFKPTNPIEENPGMDELEVLTLTDVAQMLHCSKAHVCNCINGKVVFLPCRPSRLDGAS